MVPEGWQAVPESIARWAARDPEAMAVSRDGESMTYGSLCTHAGLVARHLAELGVGPEVPVGLFLERSPGAVVGLLGILGAGGVYLPLDTEHPADRLAFLLADARPSVVLTRRELVPRLSRAETLHIVSIEDVLGQDPESGTSAAPVPSLRPLGLDPQNLAYIIYTSGSSGRPKGTGVCHGAIARHCQQMAQLWGLAPGDRVLQFYGLSFDLSIEQILPPLSAGAGVVLRGQRGWSPDELAQRVVDEGLTMMSLPPAFLRAAAQEWAGKGERLPGDRLRLVTSGGERMDPERVALWRQGPWGALPLVNAYGPTEAVITATLHVLEASTEIPDSVPIGRPLEGRTAHRLDARGLPVPANRPGELCLGGQGLARGYRGRPARTAKRFVPDPFSEQPGSRLYRTGDLVQELPSGELDFLGRIDQQVKVRGFRIEPGEIEAALRDHPGVADAVVVVQTDGTGDGRLVAYAVPTPDSTLEGAELRRTLEDRLPAHMVPSTFVPLDTLPLTPGGKVDRQALPRPKPQRPEQEVPYRAPRSEREEELATLWAELLGADRVGVDDAFVDLGGHSLLAIQLASRVRERTGMNLPLANPFAVPTIAELAKRLDGATGAPAEEALQALPRSGNIPLSCSQERVWFLHRMTPENRAYQTQFILHLRGPLSVPALAGALREIVRRHEIFRTTFPLVDGSPAQAIHDDGQSRLPGIDLSALPPKRRHAEAHRLMCDGIQYPFHLERLPFLRNVLVTLGPEEHQLAIVEHHLVHDGWSNNVFLGELATLYRAAAIGKPSPLPEPSVQFADYAVWQRRWLEGAEAAEQLAWWKQNLAGCRPLELPTDRPRPAVPSYRGAAPRFDLPADLCLKLRALARERRTTLFAAMLTAFNVLFHRITGQDDLCIGSGVANRRQRLSEGLIGMIVNNVVLRTDVSGHPSFDELLSRSMAVAAAAYDRQDLPFDKVVEAVRPERHRGFNPLFQAMLSFHDSAMPEFQLPHLESHVEGLISNGSSKFDFNIIMIPRSDQARHWRSGGRPEEITVSWEYSSDLFDAATIERMIGHFRQLLESAVEAPEKPLTTLSLLGTAERHQVLARYARRGQLEVHRLDHRLLRRAEANPDAVAVIFGEDVISYGTLWRRSQDVAALLLARGVGPESPVALLLERSPDLVIAMLGVLRAGGHYVPLEPSLPDERLHWLLEDAGAKVALTETHLAPRLEGAVDALSMDRLPQTDLAVALPETHGDAHGAYVIYTSGTTGRPKGVMVSHANVSRLFDAAQEHFHFTPHDAWTLFHSAAFDFSVWEIWGPLLSGARLVIVPEASRRAPGDFLTLLRHQRVSVLSQTPSAFRQLARTHELKGGDLPALRWVVFGGEALDAPTLAPWFRRYPQGGTRLVNMYGITETTVHVTWREVLAQDDAPANAVGEPLLDLEVLLLDRHLQPVPQGLGGEIFVGGAGLARGYLGRPALTAERFVPHPWSRETGGRLYRSGDLARSGNAGGLHHLGRIDHQVKVRGFRIEPGEVEAALDRHPQVASCAVLALPDGAGELRLTACVVAPDTVLDVGELRTFLGHHLPEHMVPTAFLEVPELPLNANGKLDRAALAHLVRSGAGVRGEPRATVVAPTTPLEERLVDLWAEVLEVEKLGVEDDFFELGGYSLLAVRLLHRVREDFDVEVPPGDLFEQPTVRGLAAAILRAPTGRPEAAVGASSAPLSSAQLRLWFLDRLQPHTPLYNIARSVRIEGPLDPAALAAALSVIRRRHQVLRTVFVPDQGPEGEPLQVVWEDSCSLPQVDLGALDPATRQTEAQRLARAEARRPFDLVRGPLLRLTLLALNTGDTGPREHRLLLTLHHTVADAWSMALLFRELAELLDAAHVGRAARLPALTHQYADFARWQRQRLEGEALEREVDWWREHLADAPALLELPADRPRPATPSGQGGLVPFAVEPAVGQALAALGQQSRASLFMTLLAAYAALLTRLTGRRDPVVGTPVANRARREWTPLVGFFLNTLALRMDLSGDPPFQDLLDRVRRSALEAYGHSEVPFERLVEQLHPERASGLTPLLQTLFILDTSPPEPLRHRLTLTPEPVHSGTAKFDLLLMVESSSQGLRGHCEYSRDLFDATTAQRLMGHWTTLLRSLAEDPERPVSRLPLLTPAQRHQLLEWGEGPAPSEGDLLGRFAQQVEQQPESVAVLEGAFHLSYSELQRRSHRLAAHLKARGVAPGGRVALHLGRGAAMPVGVLAVLQTGAACLPLDSAYPEDRIHWMLQDAHAQHLLVLPELRHTLPQTSARTIPFAHPEGQATPPPHRPHPEAPLYTLYTSGSTGRPKGVTLNHGALANLVTWQVRHTPGRPTTLQFAALSFDVSFQEMFTTWCAGAPLVLLEEEVRRDATALSEHLTQSRVERLFLPVAALEHLAEVANEDSACALGEVITAGEQLRITPEVARFFAQRPRCRLVNHYGPSETHVATAWPLPGPAQDWRARPAIGRPVGGGRVRVLDSQSWPAVPGVIGELFLGGLPVGQGYLDRPAVTAERYLPDPCPTAAPGARLYRTGDRARLRADGVLEFLGRMDDQVKLRGYRIEPGEIESVLAAHPAVAEAVAVVRDRGSGGSGSRQLVACLVLRGAESEDLLTELRQHLSERLPAYMVPGRFEVLDALPLTPSGKVNRRALAKAPATALDAPQRAPQSTVEQRLAALWGEVLGVETVGLDDDFFTLGGHSILATRVLSRLRRDLGVALPLAELFTHSRLIDFATAVEAAQPAERPPVAAIVPQSRPVRRIRALDRSQYRLPTRERSS